VHRFGPGVGGATPRLDHGAPLTAGYTGILPEHRLVSSIIEMPPFGGDRATVTRVLRRARFVVDLGEPLIEVATSAYCTLSVGTWRDGTVYNMRAYVGQKIKAGDPIAEMGDGPIETFEGAVFIAYRRSDSSGYTGRIYDAAVRDLGRHQVFRDIGSTKPGRSFVEQVTAALQRTRLMIVVIGPGWLDAVASRGERRIADPEDLHRVEIRTALERRGRIVPVLVGRATMPRKDELPQDIQAFAEQHAIEITDRRWDQDAKELSDTIAELLPQGEPFFPHGSG
jgi:hypothetical protein